MKSGSEGEPQLVEELRRAREKIAELEKLKEKQERAEEALRRSEEQFHSVFNNLKDAVFIESPDGRILDVNEAACSMLGYTREELLSMRVGDIVPPERAARLPATIQSQTVRQGVYVETEELRKDGTRIPVEVSNTLVEISGEKRVVAIVRDITGRKKAEESLLKAREELERRVKERTSDLARANDALRKSEEKYRSLVENIPDVAWTTDRKGKTVFITPNIEEIYGFSPREIYDGGPEIWFGRIHPDDVERVKSAYEDLFSGGGTLDVEYRIRRKDGKWIWLHDRSVQTYEKDGVLYADGVLSDITERRNAEEALRESEEKYRALAENSPDVIMRFDKDLRHTYVNPAVTRVTGMSPDDFIGKTHREIGFPLNMCVFWEDQIRKVFRTGKSHRVEFELDAKPGRVTFEWLLIPEFTPEGSVGTVLGVSRDITDLKRAVERVASEHQQLLSIFDSIDEVVYVSDPETYEILYVNKALREKFGDVVGGKCYEVFQKQPAPCPFCTNDRIFNNGGEPYIWEFRNIRDGRWYRCIDKAILWPDGRMVRYEMAIDITDSKKAEEAVRESEEKYRALMNDASDAIMLFDTRGNMREVNRKAEDLLGYGKTRLMGMHFSEIYPRGKRRRVREVFKKIVREGRGALIDVTVTRKDGAEVPVDVTASVIEYGGKKVVQAIFRDISERKKIERMKDNLIRDVSHSLKTPIAMVEMACEMNKQAIESKDLEGIRAAQRIAVKNLRTLSKDVNNILELFALEKRALAEKRGWVSLKKVIGEIISDLSYAIEDKRLTAKVEISQAADRVLARKRDMRTLFYNLIDNAIKFTQKGGITVKGAVRGKWVEIIVRDTGEGIALKDRSAVFERFYKRDSAVPGTGLGLAICREIVKMYNGEIEVGSRGRGRGTTVVVRLPRK